MLLCMSTTTIGTLLIHLQLVSARVPQLIVFVGVCVRAYTELLSPHNLCTQIKLCATKLLVCIVLLNYQ